MNLGLTAGISIRSELTFLSDTLIYNANVVVCEAGECEAHNTMSGLFLTPKRNRILPTLNVGVQYQWESTRRLALQARVYYAHQLRPGFISGTLRAHTEVPKTSTVRWPGHFGDEL